LVRIAYLIFGLLAITDLLVADFFLHGQE
jgi:hypothetical protein